MRTSMGFDSFLNSTYLPRWFPLSNLHVGQHKLLSMLNMKKDGSGNAVWDPDATGTGSLQGTHVPMEPRNRYRVGVMGGGISGLACSLELLRLGDSQDIDIEVVLLEGRNRLGGRLLTDRETFKRTDGSTPFPVDLGAGWIHGIDHNPLASLAREAGISFVTTSEEVKMLRGGLREVDKDVDQKMGKLFDDLLDLGVSLQCREVAFIAWVDASDLFSILSCFDKG
jgi:Flavin containing amine oxidoreductase